MNTDEAKKVLSFYRPGSADARDPAFAEALDLVRPKNAAQHPDLAKWFDEHCANYAALRAKFKEIPVPPALKEQILAERKITTLPAPEKRSLSPWLALAAGLVLLACALPFFLHRGAESSPFISFRNQMVRTALTGYSMDLEATNQDTVRAYLAKHSAPANYVLPPRLDTVNLVGCAIEPWNNAKVSMICFRSGRPLRPGESVDLWLFVVDNSLVPGGPSALAPDFAPVSRSTVATWTRDQRTYILVGTGHKSFVERYLD